MPIVNLNRSFMERVVTLESVSVVEHFVGLEGELSVRHVER